MQLFLLSLFFINCSFQLPAYANIGLVAEDCPKAVVLYNKGTFSQDPAAKEILFKEAIPLCTDPEVISKV
ncbi:MAG: hypothetical protein Q8O11_01970, partial [Syntrophales bacterium]|nr:hypothetical protein [Syntrophales bacterium]